MRICLHPKVNAVFCILQTRLLFLFAFLVLISCETNTLSELAEVDEVEQEDPDEVNVVTYNNTVANILNNACVECHNSVTATAGIQLQNFALAREVAQSGRMIIRMTDTSNPMPPSGNLPDPLIEDVMQWIEDGLLEN